MEARDLGPRTKDAFLLLHGCPTPAEHMLGLAEKLAQRKRVLVPDLPGYGKSPLVDDPIAGTQRQIVELVRRLELHEVSIVGISVSGYHALALALGGELPVRAIVSLAGFARRYPEERTRLTGYAAGIRAGIDMTDTAVEIMYAPEFARRNPEVIARLRTWASAMDPEWYARQVEAIGALPDLSDACAQITVPVLAVAGSADLAVPPALCEEVARRVQRGRFEVIAGAGHLLLDEVPDAIYALVDEFLP